MPGDGDILSFMKVSMKELNDKLSDQSDQLSDLRSEFSKEFDKLREEQKSATEALNGLSAWRTETTKSLEGAVSRIVQLESASNSFSRETNKISQIEAKLEKAEQMLRNYQIQADIDKREREIIMPRLNTNNRSEVFMAVQKNLMKVADSLGFPSSLVGIKPMGPGIGCLSFPSSLMRDNALSAFRQVSPPHPGVYPNPRYEGVSRRPEPCQIVPL